MLRQWEMSREIQDLEEIGSYDGLFQDDAAQVFYPHNNKINLNFCELSLFCKVLAKRWITFEKQEYRDVSRDVIKI